MILQTLQPASGRTRGAMSLRTRRPRRLTADEEKALARRIESGDTQAKQLMVECNLGLVSTLASSYRGRGVPFADLLQEGAVGLMRAVEGFDHRRDVKFSTYSVWWIRRSLLDAIAAARTIRIPPQAVQQLAGVRRAEDELKREGGQPPSTGEIAERTGLSKPSVGMLQSAACVTASLDEPIGTESRPLSEALEDPHGVDPERQVADNETRREAWSLLRTLPDRHRQVVMRRYGLGGRPAQSHREIGALLGVKEERSRQLEREALHRLRELATPAQHAA